MKISKEVHQIIALFLIWRLILFLLSLVVISSFDLSYPLKTFGEINIFKLWGNWDGGHYIGIAVNGYAHIMQYAFFPLYPILIKTLNFIIPDPYIAALLISNLALLGALIMLYKVAVIYGLSKKTALIAPYLLLLFPSSFFLAAVYAESLFLFLCLSALYLAKTNHWFSASLITGFACFTKFVAIIMIAVLLIEYLNKCNLSAKNIYKNIKSQRIDEPLVYLFFFAPFGFYLYSLFLFWDTGYWFFFRDAQMHWGRSLSIVNPITVISDSLRMYLLDRKFGYLNFSVHTMEAIIVIVFISLLPFVYKRFGFALTLYSAVITIFTLLSGKVDSSLRYVLTAFPIFMLLADWFDRYPQVRFLLTFLFAPLLGILTLLFLTEHWAG